MKTYKKCLICVSSLLALLLAVKVEAVAEATSGRLIPRIIADVDPGIDDIEGLVFLINADNKQLLKLEAIIVTEGNTHYENGIRNVFLLLEVTDRKDIPVYLGSKRSILESDTLMGGYYGEDGLGDLPWKTKAPVHLLQKEGGFDAIARLTKRYAGQITYMTMAPMSTLGITFLLYPEVADNLKEIYAMGGLYYGNEGEFNVKFDAEATDIVLRAMKTKMTLVTWQAGETNSPKTDWYKNVTLVNNPAWNFMTRIQDAINKMLFGEDLTNAKWEHCDPIVPAIFLNPGIIKESFSNPLQIEVGRGEGRGLMSNATKGQDVKVVLEVDYDLMLSNFVDAFKGVCSTKRVKCQEVY